MSKTLYMQFCESCSWCCLLQEHPLVPRGCPDCGNLTLYHAYSPLAIRDKMLKGNLKQDSILQEADQLTSNEKREAYGPVEESFGRIARLWSDILRSEVTAQQVALMMIGFKVLRESHKHSRDNLVDICGYAKLKGKLHEMALDKQEEA